MACLGVFCDYEQSFVVKSQGATSTPRYLNFPEFSFSRASAKPSSVNANFSITAQYDDEPQN